MQHLNNLQCAQEADQWLHTQTHAAQHALQQPPDNTPTRAERTVAFPRVQSVHHARQQVTGSMQATTGMPTAWSWEHYQLGSVTCTMHSQLTTSGLRTPCTGFRTPAEPVNMLHQQRRHKTNTSQTEIHQLIYAGSMREEPSAQDALAHCNAGRLCSCTMLGCVCAECISSTVHQCYSYIGVYIYSHTTPGFAVRQCALASCTTQYLHTLANADTDVYEHTQDIFLTTMNMPQYANANCILRPNPQHSDCCYTLAHQGSCMHAVLPKSQWHCSSNALQH
jgi:hypothetical protein